MTTMKPKSHVHKKGKHWVYFKKSAKQTESVGKKIQTEDAEHTEKQTSKVFKKKHKRKRTKLSKQQVEKLNELPAASQAKSGPAMKEPSKNKEGPLKAIEMDPSVLGSKNQRAAKDSERTKQKKRNEKRRLKILKRKQKEVENGSMTNAPCGDTKSVKETIDKSGCEGGSGPGKGDNGDSIQPGNKGTSHTSKMLRNKTKKRKRQGDTHQKNAAKRSRQDAEIVNSGMSSGAETPVLPSQPQDVAANWKALVSKLKSSGSSKKTSKVKNRANSSRETTKGEIWFDDVDPALLETEKMLSGGGKNSVMKDAGESDGEISTQITKCVALDCEMVGIGHEGKDSILARVSMVNEYGHCIYDKFVKPREKVTDYRTAVSGVRPSDLFRGKAEEFLTVQKEVAAIMKDRILVGHALRNDMKVLFLGHPRKFVRDTATYPPFRELMKTKRPALRKLAKTVLGITIQEGEHSSVEDARTTMRLYTLHRSSWERALKHRTRPQPSKK